MQDRDGRGWRQVLRRLIGAPDYEAYLEHCQQVGHSPLTEQEYLKDFFTARGERGRCC